jgi:hypothetical protein
VRERFEEIEAEVRATAGENRRRSTPPSSRCASPTSRKKAWQRVLELHGKLPHELRETPVAWKQLAVALNRLGERP